MLFDGGNADAMVLDGDPVILTFFGKGNEDLIPLEAEFDRIADEVVQYPADLSGVRQYQLFFIGQRDIDHLRFFVSIELHELGTRCHQLFQIEGGLVEKDTFPIKVFLQQFVDEVETIGGPISDKTEQFGLLIFIFSQDQSGHHFYAANRASQVMRHDLQDPVFFLNQPLMSLQVLSDQQRECNSHKK